MEFNLEDLRTIIISVAGSIVFALLIYFFKDYWKNKREKQESEAMKVEQENAIKGRYITEHTKIQNAVAEIEYLLKQKLYHDVLAHCRALLKELDNAKEVSSKEHAYYHWLIKKKEGESYFELRLYGHVEENCVKAIKAYQDAIKIVESEKYETEGIEYYYLGNAHAALAEVRNKEENLKLAITSYEKCATFCDPEKEYVVYCESLFFMSQAYMSLAEVRDEEENFNQAIACHRKGAAIIKGKPEYSEMDDAINNAKLGHILIRMAQTGIDKEKNIREAIDHLLNLKKFLSYEKEADHLGETLVNLGVSYSVLNTVTKDDRYVQLSLDCLNEALEIFKKETHPYYYAKTKANVGVISSSTAEKSARPETVYEEAITNMKDALEIYTLQHYPIDYANVQVSLASIYRNYSEIKDAPQNLALAEKHIQYALKVFNEKDYPVQNELCAKILEQT